VFELDLRVRVRQMSRGMRQKLGLILALAPRPRVLILDEPSTALDPLMQDVLRRELRAMAAAGHTVFFSSHTLAEVEALCDSVAIVREGRIVAAEPLEQLRKRAGHEVTIRFRADSPVVEPPVQLRSAVRQAGVLSGVWHGPTAELIAWLHARPIEDVTITPPSLEALFRGFYQSDERADGREVGR
jgi:ABC-2 type transport system ATP-binding protein